MPTSMVLRFRDLVGETIPEHTKIIEESGYVWWGWWNKPDERIPFRTFSQFRRTIKEKGKLVIFLVDSGAHILYEANLTNIDASLDEERKNCQEPEKVPKYYSPAGYKVWFCLSKIKKISSDKIREFSYDEVPDFLDDPTSSEFRNKRVSSIEEMINRRHRTIYFIKPYDSIHHKDYDIELMPSVGQKKIIEPGRKRRVEVLPDIKYKDFMTKPIFSDSTYVLHLSDLHFSKTHHNFAANGNRIDQTLVAQINADIDRVCDDKAPAVVVISGDITWLAQPKEFEQAYNFIDRLKSMTGLSSEHFIIVPGNHDIQWSKQSKNKYNRSKKVELPKKTAERNYRKFFKTIFGFNPNKYLSMGRRYVLGNFVTIDIIGLNSSMLEDRHFAGYGFVGLNQLNNAALAMGWDSDNHGIKYRMLVFHHHVIPVTPQEEIDDYDRIYSLTLDSGQLVYKTLELQVDIILHGHMHQPFASCISRTARDSKFPAPRSIGVHGAGSAGVTRKYLGTIGKNSYNIYQFTEEGVIVNMRTTSENVKEFGKDWECRLERNPDGGMLLKNLIQG